MPPSSRANLSTFVENETLYITLNRPEKHNCFGIQELEEVDALLRDCESDPGVRVVVFRGAGERAFSAGADLKQFEHLDRAGTVEWIKKGHAVFNYVERFPKPTVAVIQGYALGGGLELALACDFRVASDRATLGCPELRHGWLPGWGGLYRLTRLLGESRAKEIIFLAEHISAEEAYRIGLVHRFTCSEDLERETEGILEKLRKLEPNMVAMAKAAILESSGTTLPSSSDVWFDVLGTLYAKG